MKRGVVKVTACCLAGSVIFASTGLTAFAAGGDAISRNRS